MIVAWHTAARHTTHTAHLSHSGGGLILLLLLSLLPQLILFRKLLREFKVILSTVKLLLEHMDWPILAVDSFLKLIGILIKIDFERSLGVLQCIFPVSEGTCGFDVNFMCLGTVRVHLQRGVKADKGIGRLLLLQETVTEIGKHHWVADAGECFNVLRLNSVNAEWFRG